MGTHLGAVAIVESPRGQPGAKPLGKPLGELGRRAPMLEGSGMEGKMTIRAVLLWITGTAASAIVGGLIVEWLRLRGINFIVGALAGGCAFACMRLWVEERATPSKGPSKG